MIPVLSLADPAAGAAFLCRYLGFVPDPADPHLLVREGQRLHLAAIGQPPRGLVALPFDHLAMRVGDADRAAADGLARGAEFHPGFTPDGPCEIAEFGPGGVRYIFFRGPEGWPFEFVASLGSAGGETRGHAHFGLRTDDVAGAATRLKAMGAATVARHRLGEGPDAVNVEFLGLGESVFEVFDAAPDSAVAGPGGWIGFLSSGDGRA